MPSNIGGGDPIGGGGGGGPGGGGIGGFPAGGAAGSASAQARSGVALRARGRNRTGPVALPVQMDSYPEHYDANAMNRILDGVVRQLSAVQEGPLPDAKPAQESDDAEVLAWLL